MFLFWGNRVFVPEPQLACSDPPVSIFTSLGRHSQFHLSDMLASPAHGCFGMGLENVCAVKKDMTALIWIRNWHRNTLESSSSTNCIFKTRVPLWVIQQESTPLAFLTHLWFLLPQGKSWISDPLQELLIVNLTVSFHWAASQCYLLFFAPDKVSCVPGDANIHETSEQKGLHETEI